MCGIAGHVGELNAGFEAALAALAFRGPDAVGSVALEGFALGCRRLAITDPAAGQPIVVGAIGQRQAVVMNGSIAGAARLRARLAARAEPAQTGNDAELPLRLYRARGLAGLAELHGQFAFAIWDEARECLVLGRDRFGEKPLFVDARDGHAGFPSFASTAAGLAALAPASGSRPDPESSAFRRDAARFSRFGWTDLETSCFGLPIRAFPRSTVRLFDRSGLVAERALDAPRVTPGRELEDLLLESVADRLGGDRPLGIFLSGGIDSSLIAWAARELGHRPTCFTLDFEGGTHEGERAARIARHLELPHVRVSIDADVLDELPRLVRASGLPVGDPSVLAVYALARAAKEHGVGVVLSGEGGDELFFGYRRQRALGWAQLANGVLPSSWTALIASLGRGTGPLARLMRASASGSYGDLLSVADPRWVQRLFGVAGALPAARPVRLSSFDQAREIDVAGYLAWDLCPKLDLGSLAAGIEARSPLLDARLAGWARACVRRPGEAHGKPALRALLARALPASLRGGVKRGFAPPIARWLTAKPWVRGAVLSGSAPYDSRVAGELWSAFESGASGHAHLVFNLCSLSVWARDGA